MDIKAKLVVLSTKDTEPLKWRSGLSGYLKKAYGSSQWSQFYDERLTKDFDHLRSAANSDLADESLVALSYCYYAYLEQLYLRLGNGSSRLHIDFVWYDAEHSGVPSSVKHSQTNVVFEKACVLFNIGALLIKVANSKVNDNSKVAISNLSKAVACFEYMSENFLSSPSADLQAENTKFLSLLCHAEAQELFLLKLLNGSEFKKQCSLISKLALAASRLYETCHELRETSEAKLSSYGLPTWNTDIKFKFLFYRIVAAYHYSLVLESQNRVGEAIAFLNTAMEDMETIKPLKLGMEQFFNLDVVLELLKTAHRQLVKDNDYIYHESIPQQVSMENIKSMDAIKVPSWDSQLESYMKEIDDKCNVLFKGIVPIDVYEKESIYSESKAALFRKEREAVEMADLTYDSFSEFTNLPILINDLDKTYNGVGFINADRSQQNLMQQQIETWIQMIKKSPFANINEQSKIILQKREAIMEVLKQLPESEKVNVVKLKTSLIEASQSDEKLFELVKPHIDQFELLKKPNEVWKKFDSFNYEVGASQSLLDIDDSANQTIKTKINKLKSLSENLKVLKEERGSNLNELKQKLDEDDITSLIIKNKRSSDAVIKQLFENELEKFSPLSTRIEATIYKQNSVVNEIKIEIDDIFRLSGFHDKSLKEKEGTFKRKEFFEELKTAMTNFTIFGNLIAKGIQFYASLQEMSEQLLSTSKSSTAPKLEPVEKQLQNMTMTDTPPTINRPAIPIPGAMMNSIPAVPPKKPVDSTQNQNPTAFYNNPSVFNENLYSKFSG